MDLQYDVVFEPGLRHRNNPVYHAKYNNKERIMCGKNTHAPNVEWALAPSEQNINCPYCLQSIQGIVNAIAKRKQQLLDQRSGK